jgi:hypothetical protein
MWLAENEVLTEGIAKVIVGVNPDLAVQDAKVKECMLGQRHAHYCLSLHQ